MSTGDARSAQFAVIFNAFALNGRGRFFIGAGARAGFFIPTLIRQKQRAAGRSRSCTAPIWRNGNPNACGDIPADQCARCRHDDRVSDCARSHGNMGSELRLSEASSDVHSSRDTTADGRFFTLFGLGQEPSEFAVRLKDPPLPWLTSRSSLLLFGDLPYAEELIRGLRR